MSCAMRISIAFLGVSIFVACHGAAFDAMPPGGGVGLGLCVVVCTLRHRTERLQGSFESLRRCLYIS